MDISTDFRKAREFLHSLGRRSPAELSEDSQRALVKIFYNKIKSRGGSHPVETAPKENIYRVAMKLYEYSQNLSKEPIYLTLGELEKAIEQRDIVKIEKLEERVCIQLEACNIKDKELESYHKRFKKRKDGFLFN